MIKYINKGVERAKKKFDELYENSEVIKELKKRGEDVEKSRKI